MDVQVWIRSVTRLRMKCNVKLDKEKRTELTDWHEVQKQVQMQSLLTPKEWAVVAIFILLGLALQH